MEPGHPIWLRSSDRVGIRVDRFRQADETVRRATYYDMG